MANVALDFRLLWPLVVLETLKAFSAVAGSQTNLLPFVSLVTCQRLK